MCFCKVKETIQKVGVFQKAGHVTYLGKFTLIKKTDDLTFLKTEGTFRLSNHSNSFSVYNLLRSRLAIITTIFFFVHCKL